MTLVNVTSAALQKTLDALSGQIKAVQGITAGRQPSNAESRTLQTLEEERDATKALYEQACRTEDEESRAQHAAAFRGWTPEAVAGMNVHLQNPNATAEERAAKIAEVLGAPAPGAQQETPGSAGRRFSFPSLPFSALMFPAQVTNPQLNPRFLAT